MTGAEILRDLLAFCLSFLLVLVLTPIARNLALRVGFVDRPASHKFHSEPTPYLGGLAVAVVVLGSIVVQLLANHSLHLRIAAFGIGAAIVGTIGLLDDWRGLGIAPRVVAQAAAACVLWIGGIRLEPSGFAPVDLAVTVLVVVLVTNSINLLDNMDGVAAGTVAIAALTCYVMATWGGQLLIAPLALTVAGACVGFLRYNFPPASIFLGDAGSLLLGFCLAAILIEVKLPADPLLTRVVASALVIAVPLFDTMLVVVSRRRGGRPVLRGGTDHLSHRLRRSGLTPRGTAVAIYLLSAASGALALALMRSANSFATATILASLIVGLPILIRALERPVPGGAKTSQIANTSPQARDTLRGAN
jgi:UDP-GlcNAc:undecaprenyl-phosphate GlcNAc-1-phosphate transferase